MDSSVGRYVIGAHVVASGWLLLNGVAHQIQVLWKAWRGTLKHPQDLSALLAIGVGLVVSGIVMTWTLAPLTRSSSPSVWPALASLALLAAVLAGIAVRFGFTFLFGSIIVGVIDLALLGGYAIFSSQAYHAG